MRHLPLTLRPRLFALLTLGFVLATIVGTVSHEGGHYVVSESLGHDAYIGYAYTGSQRISDEDIDKLDSLFKADRQKITAPEYSPEKEHYLKFREEVASRMDKRTETESILILLGGPVQTMLFGSMGFWLLWRWYKKGRLNDPLKVRHWLAVLLTFFWSRQVFNFATSIPYFIAGKRLNGDETRLARYFGWPEWSVGLLLFVPAAITLLWVTFRAIPAQQRLSFLVAGIAGSAFGWYIWMYWLGPRLLP